jgi:hypothetical protein
MKFFLQGLLFCFLTISAFSQKVTVSVAKVSNVASSDWMITDEQNNIVFDGNSYLGDDTVTFGLEANKRFFFNTSVASIYDPDTTLYTFFLNNEPLFIVSCRTGIGDHTFPFFTGIKEKDTKIVGGTSTTISSFPWQVYYIAGSYACGGSIIDGNWVLTAAHCTKDDNDNPISVSSMYIRVGSNDPIYTQDGKKYTVSEVIIHEGYDSKTLENDIALLKINGPISYTNATPVKLISSVDVSNGATDPGVMSWVTGWGLTKINPQTFPHALQKVQLPIVSDSQASVVWESIPSTDIMAGYLDGNKDACNGDSGGPLVVPVYGEYKLAGIVSWGSEYCNTYGGYTKVSDFSAWIASKSGVLSPYTPPAPTGDSIVCSGTISDQYIVQNVPSATSYEWKLYPAEAGTISGSGQSADVTWNPLYVGTVRVMLRVTLGGVLSDWSVMKVNIVKNTRLISQPRDTSICTGQSIAFDVSAEGYNMVYTWTRDGNILQTGSSNRLYLYNTTSVNSGNYKCKIEGSCGTVYSIAKNLTVYPLTNILSISNDVISPYGSDVTLDVSTEGHDLSYSWEKDNNVIDNTNDSRLTLPSVDANDIGLYRVTVKGTCGIKTSDTVYVYISNDNIPSGTELYVWPTVSNSSFNIALSTDEQYDVYIFNSNGSVIKILTYLRYQNNIDISKLPKGVYILRVSGKSFKKSIRIIKS